MCLRDMHTLKTARVDKKSFWKSLPPLPLPLYARGLSYILMIVRCSLLTDGAIEPHILVAVLKQVTGMHEQWIYM